MNLTCRHPAADSETVTIVIPAGHWVRVYEGSMQVYPWTSVSPFSN